MDQQPVSFPQWKAELSRAALSPNRREIFRREILSYLHHCKVQRSPASVASIKLYLDERERQSAGPTHPANSGQAREALRWFYRAAKAAAESQRTEDRRQRTVVGNTENGGRSLGKNATAASRAEGVRERTDPQGRDDEGGGLSSPEPRSKNQRPQNWRKDHPPTASDDLGRTPWERDLIKASREKGYLWRTEETYREWAVRFADFLAPRTPYVAEGKDVADFLSLLAVSQRASQSTQKQALNALVFFMQQGLHRELGKFEFQRAQRGQKIPTVLSQEECGQLLAGLTGTPRLMAEVMYGSGVRLMELLRLRIHHLDLARGRIQVYAGKGDRVNGFADAMVDLTC